MGLLQFYYDKIISEQFFISPEKDFLLNEWNPDEKPITQTKFYEIVSNQIMNQYKMIYEDKLQEQIWKVIRSLRRIILKNEEIGTQFETLCEINKTLPEQRTPAWYAFRENLLTASSWGNILGYIGSPREVLLQKLGHEGSQFKGNEFTRWGTKYEPVATSIYEKRTGKNVTDFGCMRHPDENNFFIGASPDGISNDGVMLEIKCPPKRVIGNIPTNYYWAQMQGQLEVCDLEQCDFLECKLEEYKSQEQYLEDLGENATKSYGMESGVVLTFKKGDDLSYVYSKFFINEPELSQWVVDNIKENKGSQFVGPSYWKIITYQCQPVFRDREWFAWAREQLKLFYDQWQFYKKHGYESLLTERQVKPKASKSESTYLTDYEGFTIVSEQGEETEVLVKKLTKFGFTSSQTNKTEEIDNSVPKKNIEFNYKSNDESVEKDSSQSSTPVSKRFAFK